MSDSLLVVAAGIAGITALAVLFPYVSGLISAQRTKELDTALMALTLRKERGEALTIADIEQLMQHVTVERYMGSKERSDLIEGLLDASVGQNGPSSAKLGDLAEGLVHLTPLLTSLNECG